MRFFSVFAALAVSATLTSQAHAGDLSCEIQAVAKCLCPASMTLDCGSVKGYVDNDEPVKSVVIAYRTASGKKGTLLLQNPKSTAMELYAAKSNAEVKAALRTKGVDPATTEADVQLLTLDGSAKIYEDPYKKQLASSSDAGEGSRHSGCVWVGLPQVVKATGCGSAICTGTVSCRKGSERGEGLAGCKAKADGKSCGTAQACAEDPDVTFAESDTVNADGPMIKAKVESGAESAK